MGFLALFKLIPIRDWIFAALFAGIVGYHFLAVHEAYDQGGTDERAEAAKTAAAQDAQIAKSAEPQNAVIEARYVTLDDALNKFTVSYAPLKATLPACGIASPDLVRLVNSTKGKPGASKL